MNNIRRHKMHFAELIIMIFFSAYFIMPKMHVVVPFLAFLLIALIYTIVNSYIDPKVRRYILIYIVLFALYSLLYLLLTETKTITSNELYGLKRFFSKFYQVYCTFFPILLYYRIWKKTNKQQQLLLLGINLLLIAYVCINTWSELELYADITRSNEAIENNSLNNVGGYYFVYLIPFIILGFTYLCYNVRVKYRFIIIPVILFLFVFLFKAQYTLSVLITVLGIILLVYKNIHDKRAKVIFVYLGFISLMLLPLFLQFLIDNISSEDMRARLGEIRTFLLSGDTSGYNMSTRISLYGDSILAFLRSPIYGNRSLDFDGHATLLTVLSDLGLLGGIPYYYLIFSSKNKMCLLMESRAWTFKIVFIMLLCMGFTNPIHSSTQIAWGAWLLVPLLIHYISKK